MREQKQRRIMFQNTEAEQAGRGIAELRRRKNQTREQFATGAEISAEYLSDLEEGRYPAVSLDIVERILKAGGVESRSKSHLRTSDELKSALLSIKRETPPMERLF